ncbi:MAG TPA: acyloxyacyl hydrolase [Stellaceae bacterium]
MNLALRLSAGVASIAALLLLSPAPAVAQQPSPAPAAPLFSPAAPPPPLAPPLITPASPAAPWPGKIIDEVKVGALAHDVGFLGHHVESGADANLEVLFTSPDILGIIGSPRPHIGGDINTDGNTSDGYFGLTWGITLIQNLFASGDGVFANGSLGGAVHDASPLTGTVQPPGHKLLGSRILFRESAELGYQVTPQLSISALLDHISNANLAPRNAGITNAGARFGFKF